MPLFPLKSLSRRHVLEDAAADRQTAQRVEQYRVGDQALYIAGFPGDQYVPFAALDRVLAKGTSISPGGCCGTQLPMVCLRLAYDGEFSQNLLFEKWASVDKVLDRIRACRPDVPVDRNAAPKG